MLKISSLDDIAALRESADVECKRAQGKDKKGMLPKDAWETYSAFANTDGGNLFLGLAENKSGEFELVGISNVDKVLEDFWTCVNNPQKVSVNVVREQWVNVLHIDGAKLIHIFIPRASRKERPVYVKGNPLVGSYKRLNTADVLLRGEDVRRLLAEQVEDSRDGILLKGYGFNDLDIESFNAYRQIYVNRDPDHPWNKLNGLEFLYQIGGWVKDRETGEEGLTRAGLLMFGSYRPILDVFPYYLVDYQERPEAKTEARWIDRLVPDGSWSGNLFDFYHRVIRKLTADLKIPFVLEGDQRQDDTLVHKALREALVNTLVHADFTGRASVLVVKRPDMFGFRNPGNMRISIEQAIEGSQSDCRNRNLQNMFRFIGLGENAGSGLPKIFDGWSSQHWRKPILKEKHVPSEQTLLELHTLSLVPEHVIQSLKAALGAEVFDCLNEEEILILVTAHIEKTVDHKRMMSILDIHPRDLSLRLAGLSEKGIIYQEGSGRGTIYFLANARLDDDLEEFTTSVGKFGDQFASSGGLGVSSGGLGVSSGGLGVSSGGIEPIVNKIVADIAATKKAPRGQVETAILKICAVQSLSIEQMTKLLSRSEGVLRKDYLQPMLKNKKLRYKYPTKPQHPDQAYITVGSDADKE